MEKTDDVLLFWGHGKNSGEAACLSNFFEGTPFVDGRGRQFRSSEHHFMAAKAEQFGDGGMVDQIIAAPNPRRAKALGRCVANFDDATWSAVSRDRMFDACLLKFSQNPRARNFLLSTGDALLVEASPYDSVWGIGLSAADARRMPREQWPGTNWLGEVLMRVRSTLANHTDDAQPHVATSTVRPARATQVSEAAPAADGPPARRDGPDESLMATPSPSIRSPGPFGEDGTCPWQTVRDAITHILVIDFEATCDRGVRNWPHEIIEFPALLLRLGQSRPEAEFARFVRPIECPTLTDFCTELTSITQAQVDAAEPLEKVLSEFRQWVASLPVQPEAIMPVTCGDWDLKTALPRECARKQIALPDILRKWMNIKHTFVQVTNNEAEHGVGKRRADGVRKAPGMAGMLAALGLPLIGRHHRGIDDARNIAAIASELHARHQMLTLR
mmetsp:Transcript_15564/g.41775  ORF Transcript_15564/g.41775 Transcript_15564/m.41775 type:complete len:444 (+) Transcript_15564:1999-3330(+)